MAETISIDDDAFIRNEGHILYATPGASSTLLKAVEGKAYTSDCKIFFGSTPTHVGQCQFKLKRSQDSSPLIVIKVGGENLGHSIVAKTIEISVPKELEQSNG